MDRKIRTLKTIITKKIRKKRKSHLSHNLRLSYLKYEPYFCNNGRVLWHVECVLKLCLTKGQHFDLFAGMFI